MRAVDYLSDPQFVALLDSWGRRRRCPLPLVDWLLERGLESQAEAARWAATAPSRPMMKLGSGDESKLRCGPFPWQFRRGRWTWWSAARSPIPSVVEEADCVPPGQLRGVAMLQDCDGDGFSSLPLALCGLLDGWSLEAGPSPSATEE